MKSKILLLCSLFVACIVIVACKKGSSDQSNLKIRLTDAPGVYQEVNIDLKEVNVKLNGEHWVKLDAVPGIYDLLGLQNGVDTLIASSPLPKEVVKEIRLVLGSENTIKVNGVVFPLIVPSGAESGLKIKVNHSLKSDIETLIIDFDAALSVHEEGTGEFKLRPVLRIK